VFALHADAAQPLATMPSLSGDAATAYTVRVARAHQLKAGEATSYVVRVDRGSASWCAAVRYDALASFHAEAQAQSRRRLPSPEPPKPLVIPTDESRATCVFADLGCRLHAQLPYEQTQKINGEAIRVTVLPFCQGACVDWSSCLGRRPSKIEDRFAHCSQCQRWAQLGEDQAAPAPDEAWACAQCG